MKSNVRITLNNTIDKHEGLTRNAIAVEGKIRPATLSELVNGKSKAISFDTLNRIISAINTLTGERHTIDDVINIEYDDTKPTEAITMETLNDYVDWIADSMNVRLNEEQAERIT